MANANVNFQGQDNSAGDDRALFYKLFTGEVLTAYDESNIMEARHRVRNIDSGKSASFGNTGKAAGEYHTPGEEILGDEIPHSETVIPVDDLLISHVFISNINEAMHHYEVRGEYSHQLGQALGRTFDKQAMRVACTAARASNKITGLPGGAQLVLSGGYAAAANDAKAAEMAEAFFAATQQFAEKDVDPSGLFAVVKPVDYYRLVQNKDLLNRDWGGAGSFSQATLPMIAGIPLVMSNHVPSQDDAVNTTGGKTTDGVDVIHGNHTGDFSKTQCFIMKADAMGTVKLMDLAIESQYDVRRQGTLIVAKMAVGHGVLRPESALEIVIP